MLAAGFATRLYPLTRDRAKPLLDIAGKPVLTRLLERVQTLPALDEILVITNDRFLESFRLWARGHVASVPIRLLTDHSQSDDDKLGGVADLALALQSAGAEEDGFLVLAGDNLLDFDLHEFQSEFRRRRESLLLCRRLPGEIPPRRHGEVQADSTGRVERFVEKPAQPRSPLTATCIYFFPPAVTDWIHEYLGAGGNPDAPGHFMAWLCARQPVHARVIPGTLHDIGNLETLEQARRAFEGKP